MSEDFTCQICGIKVVKKELFNHLMTVHSKSDMLKYIKSVGVEFVRKKK